MIEMAINRNWGKVRGQLITKDNHKKGEVAGLCSNRIKVSMTDQLNNVASQGANAKEHKDKGTSAQPSMNWIFLEIINEEGKKP